MTSHRRMGLAPSFHPVVATAFLNFIFLILVMVVFFSFFATPSGFEIRLPGVANSGMFEKQFTVRITAENVLFFNEKVVTINDLKRALFKIANTANTVVYLQVDRRSSMGRVVDVWDLCKGLGIAQVKIIPASPENIN